MKKIFKSVLVATVVVAGLSGAFAFKSDSVVKKSAATVTYVYSLSTSTGARTASNWTLTPGSGPSCGIPGDVPCKVSFDTSVYPTLQSYIDAQHFSSDAEVAFGTGVISKD
jgi:hypothetical protein